MTNIAGAINVALNGFEAKVTTKQEARALILDNVGQVVGSFAEAVPVRLLDRYCERFGIAFEVEDGRVSRIVFD